MGEWVKAFGDLYSLSWFCTCNHWSSRTAIKNFVYIASANKHDFSMVDIEQKTGTENAVFQETEENGSFQPHSTLQRDVRIGWSVGCLDAKVHFPVVWKHS